MSKPVILSVDDDPDVLKAIEQDLRSHYRSDYRVVKASSGQEALDAAVRLKKRGTPIALFLVDARMPEMSGTEMLVKAKDLYPDSRKVLLTGYADTEAAITSINEIGLDHYLLKPWDPPEERLYPVLDDLLSDWAATVRLPYDGIRVAGARWSPQSFAVKEFLSRNHVPYQWVDVDVDAGMRALVDEVEAGSTTRLPVVFFEDGSSLVSPSQRDLAERIGMRTVASRPFYDLAIVGAGPAGLAAAVYGSSEGLATLLVEEQAPGGQAGTSSQIENYLGFPAGITGADLARRATDQARRFGAEILSAQEVTAIRREDPYRVLTFADGSEVSAYAVVFAAGVAVRRLEVPGLDDLTGAGVYYGAAMTEAASYRGQDVCVVGGANSAGQGALFFSRYVRKVIMLAHSPLRKAMSHYLIDRIELTENIEVLTGVEISAVHGKEGLDCVTIVDSDGAKRDIPAAAVFIFIGATPRTDLVADLLELDEQGFVLTGPDLPRSARGIRGWTLDRDPYLLETNVPGVFAVGDVRSGSGKRVAAAVGEGSGVIGMVHRYLETV